MGLLAWDGFFVIRHAKEAFWITRPIEPRLGIFRVDRESVPPAVFTTRFDVARVPARARLHVRAVRDLALFLNDEPVDLSGAAGRSWKRMREIDVSGLLRAGPNALRAEVANPDGPPLLQLWIEGLDHRVATGPAWRVQWGERIRRAAIADDTRPYRHTNFLPSALDGLARFGWILALAFILVSGASGVSAAGATAASVPAAIGGRHWPRTALVAVGVFWAAFFTLRVVWLPAAVGFDVEGHLAYLRFLAAEARLPTASDGWSMFHPPLYHLATAALRALFATTPDSVPDRIVLHAIPACAGFATAWIAGRVAALLAPERPGISAVAIAAAGLMPMNVYMSAFVSNESVHAAIVAGALWLAARILIAPRATTGQLAGLSALLGIALLAKSTSLPIAPAVLGLVGFKLVWLERRTLLQALGAVAAMACGIGLLAGWFYWRNQVLYGTPVVTNYDVPLGTTYWIPPGYHTPDWYLSFGESLVRPYYASFVSFWDGLYSTFWGDGQGSGRMGIDVDGAPWNVFAMAAVYPLGLVGTAAILLGFGVQARRALSGDDQGRRLAHTLLLAITYGMAFMLLLITFRYPHGPLPKAFYIQPVVMPVAVAFAFGAVAFDDWLGRRAPRVARPAFHGACAALACAIVLAFLA